MITRTSGLLTLALLLLGSNNKCHTLDNSLRLNTILRETVFYKTWWIFIEVLGFYQPLSIILLLINSMKLKTGERPDIVSQRLYGTSEYYWTFFVVNEFLHDGLAAWPMSQEDLQEYMDKEYEGWVITTRPSITRNTDLIITEFRDSLAGRFELGETITGGS